MAQARFCDQCGQAFPDRQPGSAQITYTAWWGAGTHDTKDMDVCKNCNPFLQMKVRELEQRKATLEEESEAKKLQIQYPGLDEPKITDHAFQPYMQDETRCGSVKYGLMCGYPKEAHATSVVY